jgi:hypothetical protein
VVIGTVLIGTVVIGTVVISTVFAELRVRVCETRTPGVGEFTRMDDDNRVAPLSRRAPGASGRRSPPEGFTPAVLPDSVQRVARAAIDAAREEERDEEAASADRAPSPPDAEVPEEPAASPWFPIDPETDTQPFAAIVVPPATPQVSKPSPPVASPAAPPSPSAPAARPLSPSPSPPPSPSLPSSPSPAPSPSVPAGPSAGPGRASRRYRMAGALASVVLLAAGGSLAFALWRSTAAPEGGSGQGARASSAAAERAVSNLAASWVASQVSRTTIVSCDPVMCRALRAHGVPPASLISLGPAAVSPLRSQVIVATPVIRAQYGGSLESVYAPGVLASFGSGTLRIDIRVVAPRGVPAYLSAVSADVLARKASGATLLHSPLITATRSARAQLTGGEVDSRLLVTLANLAALEPVSVVAFGDLAPGASPGVPLRSADVTASAGDAAMIRYLRGQHGLYRAARIQTVRLATGQAALRIEYDAPSPLGLLAAVPH